MPLVRKDSPKPSSAPQRDATVLLVSGTTDERWAAARALAKSPEQTSALSAALLSEKDPRVRGAIFTGLAHIKTTEAVKAVLPHLRSDDASIRTAALDALSAMPEAVADHIPQLLADPDPDVRLLVCDVVRKLPGSQATTALCALIDREPMPNVCAAAIDALSEVGEREALPVLARCAKRFEHEPFLVFATKVAADRIAGNGRMHDPQIT